MFDRVKFSNRGPSPAPPGGPSRPSTSVPSLQITTSPTESDAITSTDCGGSDRPRLEHLTTTGGNSRGRKQRWSVRHTIAKLLSRSPSPDPTHIDQPNPSDPRQSDPSAPDLPSPTVPAGDGKKTIIAATRLVLQTAASALKFVPIPNLDQIPSILLTWLQVYETIDNNDENLKGLDDEVRNAQETIFRPLQLWTGQVPLEISDLIHRFNLYVHSIHRPNLNPRSQSPRTTIKANRGTQTSKACQEGNFSD
ncbi:uncharacterized protein EI90DRAFT_1087982 [Cantharellus anzutake]|uniref:uncharacterized protein n=1 Tax=Cantharellus anzutake TaxID=1750568 RepID=UPI0019089677|nr:uncharacterized protein EI90DRAFT_1087982 [Cantharellus anzutake]KAF8330690.1 hypothetical protein EI90DRAFT_1087982 [Cantharellus anzutake]